MSATDRFLAVMDLEANKCIKDADGQDAGMNAVLYDFEIDHLRNLQAWNFSEVIQKGDPQAAAHVYFHICSLIINSLNEGKVKPSTELCLYTATRTLRYDNKFFLNVNEGDRVMALDPAFICNMTAKGAGPNGTDLPQDGLYAAGGRGMKLVYVLKWAIQGPQGIKFLEAGCMFEQLLDPSGHTCMLNLLSGIMKPKLADFGACIGAGLMPGKRAQPSPSPSAASSSAMISDSGLPPMYHAGGP